MRLCGYAHAWGYAASALRLCGYASKQRLLYVMQMRHAGGTGVGVLVLVCTAWAGHTATLHAVHHSRIPLKFDLYILYLGRGWAGYL